ncbi:MAG: NTE family protein [Halieaceae bacterium]
MTEKTPINLVLGSGGARGLTHMGVVRVLAEPQYEIRSITGCSMGALVGALLVTGHLDEYEQWMRQLTRWDVLRFLDISLLGSAGIMKGDKLMERLENCWVGWNWKL